VGISLDNRWLVTGGATTRLWLLQVNDLIDSVHAVAGPNFTADEWKLYFTGEPHRKTFLNLPGP
jgi:hypothetical protein